MQLIKNLILITIFFTVLLPATGQEMRYAQSGANKIFYNPSFAGSYGQTQLFLAYRNQYSALPNGMESYAISVDGNISSYSSGIGLSVSQDIGIGGVGVLSSVYGYYSYRVIDNKHLNINIGIKGGFMVRSLSSQDLIFPDQYGGNSTTENFNINKLSSDFGVGISGSYHKFFAGIGAEHLTRPNISLNKKTYLLPSFSGFVGLRLPVYVGKYNSRTINSEIIPSISFFSDGLYTQMFSGVGYQHKMFYIGAFVSNNLSFSFLDAIIIAKLNYKNFVIGYSYDYVAVKTIGADFGNANEITIHYFFNKTQNKGVGKAIKCPRF